MPDPVLLKKSIKKMDEICDLLIERETGYGNFFSLTGKLLEFEILDALEFFRLMIALKFIREEYKHKKDNLMDICGYAFLGIVYESKLSDTILNIDSLAGLYRMHMGFLQNELIDEFSEKEKPYLESINGLLLEKNLNMKKFKAIFFRTLRKLSNAYRAQ